MKRVAKGLLLFIGSTTYVWLLFLSAGGHAFRVGISSPLDTPWSFSRCIIRPGFGTTQASKANPFRVEFFAWPVAAVTATTSKDTVLWTRSLS